MATAVKPAATPQLPEAIFGIEVKNHELLKLAYDAYLANARLASATTKKRGDVRGGGKKPWRQKGTGRARFGSSRNPIWRGGGVVFGPSGNENYVKRISTNTKRVAVRQALSLANQEGRITVIDTFSCPEGKTKETIALFAKHDITPEQQILLVVSEKDDMVRRATSNVQQVKVSSPMYLNVFNILNADKILISQKSLPIIEKWLGEEK